MFFFLFSVCLTFQLTTSICGNSLQSLKKSFFFIFSKIKYIKKQKLEDYLKKNFINFTAAHSCHGFISVVTKKKQNFKNRFY